MKNLLVVLVSICAFSVGALADHANLERQSAEASQQTRVLYYEARQVVGIYPTYHQKYALEHIQFLDRSAIRLLQTIRMSMRNEESGARDHAHDNLIRQAFNRLEHDALYARSTFDNLFVARDHASYDRLDLILDNVEHLIREMRFNLP